MYKNKKIFIIALIFILSFLFFNISLANNELQNMANGVRNVVGGAENGIEGAVRDFSNTSKDITNDMQNGANEMTNNVENTVNNMTDDNNDNDNNGNPVTSTTDGTYNATRTAATDNATFMGMNSTAWTWLIIGVVTIAIVALVWYYSMRVNNSNHDDKY